MYNELTLFLSSVRFAPIRPPQIHLNPICFEVPHQENCPIFIGREWVFKEMEQVTQRFYYYFTVMDKTKLTKWSPRFVCVIC